MSDEPNLDEVAASASVALAYGDSQLIEKLHGILSAHDISTQTAQDIKNELLGVLQSRLKNTSVDSVHKLASKCIACPNMNHDANLPAWNRVDPDVLFITESPRSFAPEGKDLFISSMTKAGFESSKCCLTYSTRCTKSGNRTAEEFSNCSSFLFAEIEALKPKLIVPLGSVPSKELLGPSIKMNASLSHPKVIWLGPWAILPCYGPNHASSQQQNLMADFSRIIKHAYDFVYGS